MMKKTEEIAQNMGTVFSLLPEGWQEKARELGAIRRARIIKTAEELLMLIMLYQTSGKSLGGTSALLKSGEGIGLDKNAVYHRILKSTEWNIWLNQNLCRSAGIIAEKPEFLGDRRIIAVDATDEKMNADGSVLARLHYGVEIYTLEPVETIATLGETGEKLTNFSNFGKGDIVLADRAYGSITSIEHMKSLGADFVIRLKYNAFTMYNSNSERFELMDAIKDMGEGSYTEFSTNYKRGGKLNPLRICVYRKTAAQAADSERKIKKSNKKKGRTAPGVNQLFAGNYVIVATTLPYECERILELYRQRWQIEMLFKRLKSLFNYDDMPAKKEATMRAFISGKLLLAGICEALVLQGRFSPE